MLSLHIIVTLVAICVTLIRTTLVSLPDFIFLGSVSDIFKDALGELQKVIVGWTSTTDLTFGVKLIKDGCHS